MFQKKRLVMFLLTIVAVFSIRWLDTAFSSNDAASDTFLKSDRAIAQETTDISLNIPVDCSLGQDCFIMHYVDLYPSEVAVDFNCGRQTYDGHKGTDFAIDDLQAMAEGVPVIAAAPGKVLRTRDGIEDKLIEDSSQRQTVAQTECGNGIVIYHGDGWETQYCHLRQGSVVVEPDTEVERGEVLGMVGASGLASFPHVHFSVRYNGEVVDPFVGSDKTQGCNQKLNPLWSQPLNYSPTGLIDAGFSDSPPTQIQLWEGSNKNEPLVKSISALIFWVHSYGVLEGDVEKWQLIAPNGTVAIEQENTLERPFRSWLTYIGKRQITPGLWQGKYQLWRDGSSILEVNREAVVEG